MNLLKIMAKIRQFFEINEKYLSDKNHQNQGKKVTSKQTQKYFLQKWTKVGNYFKKVHFLGNVVSFENIFEMV